MAETPRAQADSALRQAARRVAQDRERLLAENAQLRTALRQVRGHVITSAARSVIDEALGVPRDR
jgi:hypothetical protein